ncbi:hypothetical protein BDR26DRAFT_854346 [Obelidium mucronatum]|nr:hypothetical protein BDR26DRAFT_854346 [Obelidium mucronatum]
MSSPPTVSDEIAAPIKWAGTMPQHQDGVGNPEHWVDKNADQTSATLAITANKPHSQVNQWSHELATKSLATDLALLREDLKVLAMALSRQKTFQTAEAERCAKFLDQEQTSANTPEILDADSTLTSAQGSVPKYMVTLKHAETILSAMAEQHSTLHAEEFLSLMEARVHIRDLEAVLETKEEKLRILTKELSGAQELVASLQSQVSAASTPPPAANQQVPSVVVLESESIAGTPVPRASSESTLSVAANLFQKIRRGSMMFSASTAATAETGAVQPVIPGSFPATIKEPPVPSVEPPKAAATAAAAAATVVSAGLPDDKSAFLDACGEWFQGAETYDFFISYRVATEARTAMELYFRLKDQRIIDEYGHSRQVRVYWDKECLKKGQDWRDGFVQGLKNSRCVLLLVSAGAMEGMKRSHSSPDNVLLEWETAVMAGHKSICVPQPVFINDAAQNVKAIDSVFKFKSSNDCPKVRPGKEGAHKLSAFTTLSSVMQLQGIQLDVSEVSWSIPDLIKALQTFSPLKMAAAARQCAAEASFFRYNPDQAFDSVDFDLEFLTSNDLRQVFGGKGAEDGILKYRDNLKNLALSFRKSPSISHSSMIILAEGLKKDFFFFTQINLKGANLRDKTTWNLLAEGLAENTTLRFMNLSENDITGVPALHKAIRDHPSLEYVLVGHGFDPMPLLKGNKKPAYVEFPRCTATSLKLFAELWEYGTPAIDSLYLNDDRGLSMKDQVVPPEFCSWLAKLSGLAYFALQTTCPSFMDALICCVKENPTVEEIWFNRNGGTTDKDDEKQFEMMGKSKALKKNKGKRQAQPWFRALCSALRERGKSSSKAKIFSLNILNAGLSDEDFSLLPDVLFEMGPYLEVLTLENNLLSTISATSIFKAVSRVGEASMLYKFSLKNNDIGPSCASEICNVLRNCPKLDDFDISENPLGDEAITSICQGLSNCTKSNLNTLSVAKTNMRDSGLFAITAMLLKSHDDDGQVPITYLNVSDNEITSEGVAALGNALKDSRSKITTLDMTDLDCGPDGFQSFAEALKKPDSVLTYLDVTRCNLGDVGAYLLTEAIGPKDVTITLNGNNITGSTEFSNLITSLIANGTMPEFTISGNPLSVEFLTNLGKSVVISSLPQPQPQPQPPLCTSLSFGTCSFGNEGAQAIFSTCLPFWDTDISISFTSCGLDDGVVDFLIERFKGVETLPTGTISLLDNGITEVGFEKLLTFCMAMENIKKRNEDDVLCIELNGNPINDNWYSDNMKKIDDLKGVTLDYGPATVEFSSDYIEVGRWLPVDGGTGNTDDSEGDEKEAEGDGKVKGSEKEVEGDRKVTESQKEVEGDGKVKESEKEVEGDAQLKESEKKVEGDGKVKESPPVEE